VRGLDKLGLQLAGQQAVVDVVQDLVHQLGHDEALPGQRVGNAQLRHQEHSACRTKTSMTSWKLEAVGPSFGRLNDDSNTDLGRVCSESEPEQQKEEEEFKLMPSNKSAHKQA
jgi:hypothetical protein